MPPFQTHQRFYGKAKIHFPFSIWYLGTYYKGQGDEVVLWDYNIPYEQKRVLPDEVGISCITAQVPAVREISSFFHGPLKSKVVIGGVHPTLYPEQTRNYEYVDDIVVGHAIKDFANMPMLDYSLLHPEMMAQKKSYVGLVTSIGCPYKCTFCVNSIVEDYNKFDYWSAKRVCDEIEKAQSYGFKDVFFWDDNFFANKNRIQNFVDEVSKRSLKFEWFALTRANFDPYLMQDCHKIGLRRVSIGAESGSDEVLCKLKKGIKAEDTLRAALLLDEIGIEASFSYMIGLPGETPKQIYATIDHIKKIGQLSSLPKIVGPMLYCPYPGSQLFKECGIEEPKRFEDWTDDTTGMADTPYSLPWIKHKDMVQIYWFYSFLIPLSYKKISYLFSTFLKRTYRGRVWLLFLPLILLVATLGKVRHKLRWYRFPWETFIGKKLRGIVGS